MRVRLSGIARAGAVGAALVLLSTIVLASPTSASSSSGSSGEGAGQADATYTVTITNITDAQYLTPANYAAHSPQAEIFSRRQAASPALQAVAENGAVPVLAAALSDAIDAAGLGVSGVAGDTPIGPGQSRTFEVITNERRFSLAAMIICTNDGFAGLDTVRLPDNDGQTRNYNVHGYDAGTEINTEMRSDLVPAPFCGPGDGSTESNPELAEGGVVGRHHTLRHVGDLDPALDWSGPVAQVTITRN